MSNYIGLWQRRSIQIVDGIPHEDTVVYWLQAETYFADIRIPFNQPQPNQPLLNLNRESLLSLAQFSAFAGTIASTETWIRWHRLIDFRPDPASIDQGEVEFVGADLIEHGESEFDGVVKPYTEVWVPQIEQMQDRLVLELVEAVNLQTQTKSYPKGLWVAVGNHAIRLLDNRGYAADFTAPEPSSLSDAELQQLMQFQADYRQFAGEQGWKIQLASDPNQLGKEAHPAEWRANQFVETEQLVSGEQIEYYWQVRETAGNPDYGRSFRNPASNSCS